MSLIFIHHPMSFLYHDHLRNLDFYRLLLTNPSSIYISNVLVDIEFFHFVNTRPPKLKSDSDAIIDTDGVSISRVILKSALHVFSCNFYHAQNIKIFISFLLIYEITNMISIIMKLIKCSMTSFDF